MIKKILIGLVLIFVVVVGGFVGYLKLALPDVGEMPEIKIEPNDAMLARGEYLFNHVAICVDCHSTRDLTKFTMPIIPGTYGQGGEPFNQEMGFPGNYISRNITPFGVGDWSDQDLYRAIACGVSKDGHALFPIMPYPNYAQMDMEDLKAIMAYMRTLEPIEYVPAPSSSDFPMSLIINTIPTKPESHPKRPDRSDKVAYGKYLVTIASCGDCHTQMDHGAPIPGMDFAGGMPFPMHTGGYCYTANITPDEKTGIGNWTEDMFVMRFKAYADSNFVAYEVKEGTFNTAMPWMQYAKMEEEDLRAIYAYLRTVDPVENLVTTYEPPK